MGLILDQIGQGRAVDVDADIEKFLGDQTVSHPLRPPPIGRAAHLVKRGEIFAPMWRAHPLDPSTLLINQNWRIAAHTIPQVSGQAAQLVRRFHVAGKQDKPERIGLFEKRSLGIAQNRAFGAKNIRSLPQDQRTTTGTQSAFSEMSAAHRRRASL